MPRSVAIPDSSFSILLPSLFALDRPIHRRDHRRHEEEAGQDRQEHRGLPIVGKVKVPDVAVEIVSWEDAVLTQSHATKVGLMLAVTDELEVVAETFTSFAQPLRALTLTATVWEEPAGMATDEGAETVKLGSAVLETVP